MATIKSYTDIEQSRKLAKILPIETADMFHFIHGNNNSETIGIGYEKASAEFYSKTKHEYLACWSLSALLGVLPVIIGDVLSDNALRLRIDKSETDFDVWYENLDSGMVEEGLDIIKSNAVDACYKMIIKLNELNLL